MPNPLEEVMINVALKNVSLSDGISEAYSILHGTEHEHEIRWLLLESTGYPIAEGDNCFEGGLPPFIPEYRKVYCDGLAVRIESNVHALNGWPNKKGVPENRLQIILWKISDIESKLSSQHEFYYPPATNMDVKEASKGELVLVVQRSQLQRLLECVRQRFILEIGPLAL